MVTTAKVVVVHTVPVIFVTNVFMYIIFTKCKCCLYSVNIQQITEFSSETHDAVTSMVAMAPGTVAVVQQVNRIASFTWGTLSADNQILMFSCG